MRPQIAAAVVATLLLTATIFVRAAEVSEPQGEEDAPVPSALASAPASAAPSASHLPFFGREPPTVKDGMIRIPGGRFTMGSDDKKTPPNEHPKTVASVQTFWIDRTEVTVGDYRACVDRHACVRPEKTSVFCTYDQDDALLPVSCVRWNEADNYCRAVGKRLPREAEWERAARGPTNVRFPWGGGPGCTFAATLIHEATGRSCTGKTPSHVGTHPLGASVYGVLDLAGNVEEWTSDWYAEHVAAGTAMRAGASHVLRGGAWMLPPSMARVSARDWASANEAGPNVGFRCARDATPAEAIIQPKLPSFVRPQGSAFPRPAAIQPPPP